MYHRLSLSWGCYFLRDGEIKKDGERRGEGGGGKGGVIRAHGIQSSLRLGTPRCSELPAERREKEREGGGRGL
jgi:hypothetical protein